MINFDSETDVIMRRIATGLTAILLLLVVLPASAQQIDDAKRFQQRLLSIFQSDEQARSESIRWFVERGDPDVVPTLIVAHRFVYDADEEIDDALQKLTGHQATGWFDWMLWQQANPELKPHVGYERLRRALFASVDPAFDRFFKGDHAEPDRMRIRLEEIVWGGVPAFTGIPSLDNPTMISAAEADYLLPDDLVFGIAINGDVRAYPLRILDWHEMFNDVIGGQPVALAYCTLCGSGILFDTSVEGREEPLVFGSSGLLYRSNKLMYDHSTNSLWNQFTGEPVVGDLAFSGIRLETLPVAITTWRDWVLANPETTVLSLNTGHRRDYGSGVAYRDYFSSPDLMFPALIRKDAAVKAAGKDYVFGIRKAGVARAWPLSAFKGGQVINDRIGDQQLVLIGDASTRTVRAYESDGRTFTASPDGLPVTDDGPWQISETQLTGPSGQAWPRVAGHIAYWFAWDGYFADAATLYQASAD